MSFSTRINTLSRTLSNPVNIAGVSVRSIVTGMDALRWRTIGASLALAALVLMSDPLTILLSPLLILIHEFGHACLAWLFGYFAVPAFDFIYGGGITLQSQSRIALIMLAVYGGFGFLFYRYRRNDLTSRALLVTVTLYSICAYTPIHKLLMIAMGHGFELIFAGIFLYCALSGSGCRYAIERPLYGMLGIFTLLYNLRFAMSVLVDPEARAIYQLGKGDILDHDFVRLANECLAGNLSGVLLLFGLCCLVTPALAFLSFRYQLFLSDRVKRLLLVTHDRG